MIARLEHGPKGANPRFFVTNLEAVGQDLHDRLYCARGEMENRIKEQQLQFSSIHRALIRAGYSYKKGLAARERERRDATASTAPFVIDGPINGIRFRTYVENVFIPTLKPGDIVIMDNLGSHKATATRKAITAASSTPSHQTNAQTTSKTQDTLPSKRERL